MFVSNLKTTLLNNKVFSSHEDFVIIIIIMGQREGGREGERG